MKTNPSQAYSLFLNHVCGCDFCHAPVRRYCKVGKDLKFESDVEYVTSLKKLEDRREAIAFFDRTNPELAVRLRKRVSEVFQDRKLAVA